MGRPERRTGRQKKMREAFRLHGGSGGCVVKMTIEWSKFVDKWRAVA